MLNDVRASNNLFYGNLKSRSRVACRYLYVVLLVHWPRADPIVTICSMFSNVFNKPLNFVTLGTPIGFFLRRYKA